MKRKEKLQTKQPRNRAYFEDRNQEIFRCVGSSIPLLTVCDFHLGDLSVSRIPPSALGALAHKLAIFRPGYIIFVVYYVLSTAAPTDVSHTGPFPCRRFLVLAPVSIVQS